MLVPDFRGRDDRALEILKAAPPDVMNHNLETAPRLYKEARPGSDYQFSLNLLKKFKALHPDVPTKSGIMVGLGETDEEILQVMHDMRDHDIDMLTIGQYLAPSTIAPAGAPLCASRHLQDVRGRGLRDGLQPRRRGRDGALKLPRRPAGACAPACPTSQPSDWPGPLPDGKRPQ